MAVWFSCGAASAVAAKLTLEKYADCDVRIINNPVIEEDSDNQRFLRDVEKWLGVKIETAINPKFPDCSARTVWQKRKYMAGIKGAPCTYELKKQARYFWEKENKPDWHVLGFTAEEIDRHKRFVLTERKNTLPVLIDAGITKQMCFEIIQNAGIELPRIYTLGYPNANCIGCVKVSSPTYWNHVRKIHPNVFAERERESLSIGARLVRHKGKRMFLSDLPHDAKGRDMKTLKLPDCGIFCEEKNIKIK